MGVLTKRKHLVAPFDPMFPLPLEDCGGSNVRDDYFAEPIEAFPYPLEDCGGLTVLGQNIVQLFFRFRTLSRIRGALT